MTQKKILGVLGGNYMSPRKVAAWVEWADCVIAADSGFLRVLEAGYMPDIVIGDFDSVPVEMVDAATETVVDTGQENTDCGKLLQYVLDKGGTSITLICAEGDLTDHFLDSIHTSLRSNLEVRLGLERGHAYILKGPVTRTFEVGTGRRVSLLPLETMTNASLSGVQWSFVGRTLELKGFTSISNLSNQSSISVSFNEGSAYLFVESDETF